MKKHTKIACRLLFACVLTAGLISCAGGAGGDSDSGDNSSTAARYELKTGSQINQIFDTLGAKNVAVRFEETNAEPPAGATIKYLDIKNSDVPVWFNANDNTIYYYVYEENPGTKLILNKNSSSMFDFCKELTTIDLNRFDTSKVKNMRFMFARCKKITALSLGTFDTSKVTDMHQMFWGCDKLTDLNLASFNTSKVTDMAFMFSDCTKLTTIEADESFTTNKVTNHDGMFENCNKLQGGNGTKWESTNPADKTYARIDKPGTPGYFTKPVLVLPVVKP